MSGRTKALAGLIAILALGALIVSCYLTWDSWQTETIAGCSGDGAADCDEVLASHWSRWFGIPVSLLGMVTYVGILAICWPAAKHPTGLSSTGLLSLSLLAAGAAIWFIAVQVFVLQSFCFYCLTVHACGLTIAAITLLLIRGTPDEVDYDRMRALLGVAEPVGAMKPDRRSPMRDAVYPLSAAGAAAVGLALLMGGQLFFAPATMVVESLAGDESFPLEQEEADDPAFELAAPEAKENDDLLGDAVEPKPLKENKWENKSRRIFYKGLQKSIDISEYPLIGSPDAPHIFVEMLDYTCHHCRILHPYIEATLERYGDQVAVVVHHVPLDSRCNPNILKDYPRENHACDYARLAIGVWRLAPEEFPEFHGWLMENEEPPSIEAARERAIRIAGETVLIDDLLKAETGRRISEHCDVHRRLNIRLPILLIGQDVIRGVPKSDEEWFAFVDQELGVKLAE